MSCLNAPGIDRVNHASSCGFSFGLICPQYSEEELSIIFDNEWPMSRLCYIDKIEWVRGAVLGTMVAKQGERAARGEE